MSNTRNSQPPDGWCESIIGIAPYSGPLELVMFRIDEQRYAVALAAVQRVLPMMAWSPLPDAPSVALGVINLHGTIIPVVDVRLRFGIPPDGYQPSSFLLLVRARRLLLALPVDEVTGVRAFEAQHVTAAVNVLPALAHVAGIAALADGVLFIHDLEGFLSLGEERELDAALEAGGA